jgi:hypothetical protein
LKTTISYARAVSTTPNSTHFRCHVSFFRFRPSLSRQGRQAGRQALRCRWSAMSVNCSRVASVCCSRASSTTEATFGFATTSTRRSRTSSTTSTASASPLTLTCRSNSHPDPLAASLLLHPLSACRSPTGAPQMSHLYHILPLFSKHVLPSIFHTSPNRSRASHLHKLYSAHPHIRASPSDLRILVYDELWQQVNRDVVTCASVKRVLVVNDQPRCMRGAHWFTVAYTVHWLTA